MEDLQLVDKIILANNFEYNNQIERLSSPATIPTFEPSRYFSSEMSLLWEGDNKLVVTPHPIDEEFKRDVCNLLNFRNVFCASPFPSSGFVSKDSLNARNINLILKSLRQTKRIRVTARGATRELFAFIRHLKVLGFSPNECEYPAEGNYWCVPYIDSKAGGRELLRRVTLQHPKLLIPEGFACSDLDAALGLTRHFHQARRGAVAKSNYGSGGEGITILPADLTGADLLQSLSRKTLWRNGIVIVEEHVGSGVGSPTSTPTYNGFITTDGVAVTKGIGNQIISDSLSFLGGQFGRDVIPDELYTSLEAIGLEVGKIMASFGYRGWFNVDFLHVGQANLFYGCEINARRSGSSTLIDAAGHLFGGNWSAQKTLISYEKLPVAVHPPDYSAIRLLLLALNDEVAKQGLGLIPTIVSSLSTNRSLGVLIYGDNLDDSTRFLGEVEERLSFAN